jgi:hypothetical protein
MFFLLGSSLFIIGSYFFNDSLFSVWLLAISQLILLLRELLKGQVSGAGGFIFMSFLFFGVRPIYLVIENDYSLLSDLFRLQVDLNQVIDSMTWGSLGLLAFAIGSFLSPRLNTLFGIFKKYQFNKSPDNLVTLRQSLKLLTIQILTLVIMVYLARSGRSLYGSALGAYVYDLPIPLQSVNIVSVVALFDRVRRRRTAANISYFVFSILIFLYFTWLMREVSIFRGFYIFGVMIGFIAILQRTRPKVGYVWLLVPILVLQPFFQTLGNTRTLDNAELRQDNIINKTIRDDNALNVYWRFYDSSGDMNIFDTFIAAQLSKPKSKPYILSWLYAPVHIVPRALWKEKPEKGILQDVSFMYGAPYSPGIAGFFLLDGGLAWMSLSMFTLGIVVSLLDSYAFFMLRGLSQACIIAILVVNGMFLTRTYLWFYLWQVVYAAVPVTFIVNSLFRSRKHLHLSLHA